MHIATQDCFSVPSVECSLRQLMNLNVMFAITLVQSGTDVDTSD